MNFLSIDTEYTSFYSPDKNKSGELLQVAIIPIINGVTGEPFNEFIRPMTSVWNRHAENVHGISRKRAATFQTPKEAAERLRFFLQKHDTVFTVMGHNPTGDKRYIDRFVKEHGLINEWYTKIKSEWKCTKVLAESKKSYVPTKNCKLETLAKFFRIETNSHDALADAQVTWQIYDKMNAMISASAKKQASIGELSEVEKRKKYNDIKYVMFNGEGTIFISEYTTSDREALRIVLDEIWSTYGEI